MPINTLSMTMQPHSIRIRLSLVFLLFLLLVAGLGAFSIKQLSDFNKVSGEIRNRWLQTTRILGDLNNFTSDFRSAEGSYLLSSNPAEIAASDQEMASLDRSIASSLAGYKLIHHDDVEDRLYAQFISGWRAYRAIVDMELSLSRINRKPEGGRIYRTSSRQLYDAASDSLGRLTNWNVASARAAAERETMTYRDAYWLIVTAIVIAALMLITAIVYITKSISGPLLELARCMHRLGDNDTEIGIRGMERRDEIGEMARSVGVFRDNAIELAKSQHALAQKTSILKEALENEQRLTAQQRNFVSMTSHEFRTPLTIIDGHAQRLIKMKNRLQPEEISERADKIRSAVLRMTGLMDTLLDSSRFFDGATPFSRETFNVSALLRELCQMHREIAPDAVIREDLKRLPVTMVGDPKLLYQAFSNLISNSVKYSPAGSPIDVIGHIDSGQIVIAVEDKGIGIPEKDLDRLFERYYRGSNITAIAGTGVGLYFTEMVVMMHGGGITVESREGEGARFTIRLPQESA
ncbi:MAG: MCP four helix bundle domain-containing protein [Burkholderiales bacterium]|nr:MCP four helix bundle domain-containing protein [Burkholderiales bacterium]